VHFLQKFLRLSSAKPLVLLFGLVPFAWLFWGAATDALGANPAEFLSRATGDWTLRFLCLTLAITPLRQFLGWPELARFRRMLGLLTYFYALLHLLCYSWLDMGFDWADTVRDITKRPFIWLGFGAFVLLTLLAATSLNRAVRWLGSKRWQRLHQSVYAVAALSLLHFFWMRAGKNNFTEVWVYAAVIAVLLGWRVRRFFAKT
jgi:methionine sulfoxide reductase heme-binding subunit